MELINKDNMERQIYEMWDALGHAPDAPNPEFDEAIDNAKRIENDLRERYRKQELLRDSAPELLAALNDLIFTASNLWDNEIVIIKDPKSMTIPHPVIEQAKRVVKIATGDELSDDHVLLPGDLDVIITEAERRGWVFNNGKWYNDGYLPRTTEELYAYVKKKN